jgi:hypothetical protein
MKRKRSRLSKTEYVRLLRQRAEEEAQAWTESADRQERIKILWRELQKKSGRAKELAKDDLGGTLLELVGLQRDEINYMRAGHELCEWAKTHAADELAALREKHPLFRELRAVVARATQPTPKQASEWRRRQSRGRRYEVGLIEYEFGGPAEARLGFPYDPTCLDAILMGYGVPMEYLEWLFEMEYHRFPKKLPSVRDGRKILYSPFAVVRIMDALLKEKLPEPKPRARGGSEKKLWLSDPDRRKRVLLRIGRRAYALSRNKHILAAFMTVVCRHLPIGYLKEQLPKRFEEWLALAASWPDSGK